MQFEGIAEKFNEDIIGENNKPGNGQAYFLWNFVPVLSKSFLQLRS